MLLLKINLNSRLWYKCVKVVITAEAPLRPELAGECLKRAEDGNQQ